MIEPLGRGLHIGSGGPQVSRDRSGGGTGSAVSGGQGGSFNRTQAG